MSERAAGPTAADIRWQKTPEVARGAAEASSGGTRGATSCRSSRSRLMTTIDATETYGGARREEVDVILPDIRSSFGRDDAAQLVHLLALRGEDSARMEDIVATRGIDALLDHPEAAAAVMAETGVSRMPLALLSYVLLRRSLLDGGVESRLLADYVTSVFLHFAKEGRAHRIAPHDDDEYHYLVDIVERMSETDGRRGFLMRAHLGNFALWLSGLFPDWINHRVHRKGGPDLGYYESMGQAGFALAADDPFARRQQLDGMYREAAETFSLLRVALNRFSDRFLTPQPRSPVDRVLRQVSDDFDADRLQA